MSNEKDDLEILSTTGEFRIDDRMVGGDIRIYSQGYQVGRYDKAEGRWYIHTHTSGEVSLDEIIATINEVKATLEKLAKDYSP